MCRTAKDMLALLTTAMLLGPLSTLCASETSKLTLSADSTRVELATERQKLVFSRTDGSFALTTYVRMGEQWRALFDAGRPLLEGPCFNLQPTHYSVQADAPERKVVVFRGRHLHPDYDWELRVEAAADSPLFRFAITCTLPAPLVLDAPQPIVALWMQQAKPAYQLDQGPDSIYGSAGIPHCYGFPAAYLWDQGREAAVFFNMTPMRWMQPDGVARFHDVRIMTRGDSRQTGLGMHFKKLSGRRLPAGEMAVEFYLYQGTRAERPTGMEALDTTIRLFAPLHPANSSIPRDQLTGDFASWEQFARNAMIDLSTPQAMSEVSAAWHDEPLALVPPQETMVVHPSAQQWDFSTVNNHLTPWLLLARLHRDAEALRLGLHKADALPRFYDPRSRLIRHGTRQPPHIGDLEMCWQNFFFHEETLRAAAATGAEDFNPAVAGRLLMATAGLHDLAKQVGFVFPQWFDPYLKQPVIQNDMKQLGIVREPWQAGAYAHLMMQAFEITGETKYRTEAQQSVEVLMERMKFHVKNDVYDRQYGEPAEFPVTELFGNAWGIAAAHKLHEVTGNPKFLRYSRDFMNVLLRLTPWYEDETDPVSRDLRSAGLFYPHAGAHVATPWETVEAQLIITWTLKHDRDHPLTELLLKLSNLNRTNSFFFFPATWTEPVLALEGPNRPTRGRYFPIEPFYCLEGTGGHRGQTAAYMAGLALWNAWLYESLSEASDREIMVLNLDALENFEGAISGVEQNFLAYNPGQTSRTFRLLFHQASDADYLVKIGVDEQTHSGADLRRGVSLTLKAGEDVRITVRRGDFRECQMLFQQRQTAQNLVSHAYQILQECAVARGTAAVSPQDIQAFADALSACRSGRYAEACVVAGRIVQEHRTTSDTSWFTGGTDIQSGGRQTIGGTKMR
jgi:hypothetical protein